MAGDWIKVEHITSDKPEVYDMAAALGLDPDAVFGKLMRFWVWADQQFIAGRPARISDLAVDSMARKKGFGAAMRAVGWLGEEGTNAAIPNFERHNGETAKERALTNRRVAKSRAGSVTSETLKGDSGNARSVTNSEQKPLPEKRREEKDKEHTHTSTVVAGSGPGGVRAPLNGKSPLENADLRESAKRVLSFLNQKTGKRFPPMEGTLGMIIARLAEGATEQDCKTVVARKIRDWSDRPDMGEWLRPKTLFSAENFPNYLGECVAPTPDRAHA